MIHCRNRDSCSQYGTGTRKNDKNGATYYRFFTRPKVEKSPPRHSHTEGAEKPATADERDRVYRALLELLPREGVGAELDRRGVPDGSPLRKWYRTLPLKGRAAIARKMVEAGHEPLMARTPGFFVQTKDDGSRYWTLGGKPGLVIPVLDVAGRVALLQLRPTERGGGGKYVFFAAGKKHGPGAKNKLVPHFPAWAGSTETVRVTEGFLKADLATEAGGMLCVGLPGLHVRKLAATLTQKGVKTVRLCFDADATTNPDVAGAVAQHFRRLKKGGFAVELERWSASDGKGIDDVLAIGKAPELVTGEAVADVVAGIERAADAKARGGRVCVEVTTHQAEVRRQVVAALAANDANLYQRTSELVTIIPPAGPKPAPPGVHVLSAASIQDRITDFVFLGEVKGAGTENERFAPVHPPKWLAPAVRDAGAWPDVRPLSGVTTAPVLRADGTVHQAAGYDPVTALFYAPNATFPDVPERPACADAVAALELLKVGVNEFPWQERCDLSAWLAEVLTVCCRSAFDGAAPGFYHTANVAGSGKTALVKAAGWIATGLEVAPTAYPVTGRGVEKEEHEEEVRKLGTACAIEGHPLFLFDNVPSGTVFGSGVMDALLTATTDAGRELKTSKAPRRELRTVWTWSGNNITPRGDTSRRVIAVRLYSAEEKPEEREFTGLDVEVWAQRHRPALLVAALTVVAAYIRAGKPPVGLKPLGSFQGWSDTVRAALVWAGEPDPCSTRATVASEDPERANGLVLIQLLHACGALDKPMTAQEIVDAVKAEMNACRPYGTQELAWILAAVPSDQPRSQLYRSAFPAARLPEAGKLGYSLRKHKGRVIERMRIEQKGHNRIRAALWTVEEVQVMPPDAGDAC